MTESQELQQRVAVSVEDLAERFVMADPGDAAFLAEAASTLDSLGADLEGDYPRSSGAARSAAGRLQETVSRGDALAEPDAVGP